MVKFFILYLCIITCACQSEKTETVSTMGFDKDKWKYREDEVYPYRPLMLDSILYSDTIRSLDKSNVLEQLGDPDYQREGHFYYRLQETKLSLVKLHTRTLVIRINENDSVDWIKLHE